VKEGIMPTQEDNGLFCDESGIYPTLVDLFVARSGQAFLGPEGQTKTGEELLRQVWFSPETANQPMVRQVWLSPARVTKDNGVRVKFEGRWRTICDEVKGE
jgi:hypothetical protein